MIPVNYWAVLASAVVMIVLGSLWYGPLFGKQWMAMMGIKMPEKMTPEIQKGMMRSYAIMALGSFLLSLVLAHSIIFGKAYLGISGISAGLQGAFWNWLGFIAPVTLGPVLWENKPWKLWVLNAGYYLVGMLIIGVLLSIWV